MIIEKNGDIKAAARSAIDKFGGIKLPKKDAVVFIKPNVNTGGECPASTSKEVVAEVVKLCREAGAGKIYVGDRSWLGNPLLPNNSIKNMIQNGVKPAAEAEGAIVVGLESRGWKKVKPEGATHWGGGFKITRFLDEIKPDYIISIPVLKTHYVTGVSFSLKNTVGLVYFPDRMRFHMAGDNIFPMIAEINLPFHFDLIIVDGSHAFISGGPSEGECVQPNMIIVGDNRVEVDIECYKILQSLGMKMPWARGEDHPMIARAMELGIK